MSSAFHIIPATSDTPLFLFGDHASRHIPERYENLGLSGDDLTRHIAWDIGTEAVIRGLCERFKCGAVVAGEPYHAALSQALSALSSPLTISVHSFTPKPDLGDQRSLDLGLLVKHDEGTAQAFKDAIYRLSPRLSVGMNEPYSAYDLNHTIDFHVAPRALPHLAIEIRQDHISHDQGVARYVKLLGDALKQIMD